MNTYNTFREAEDAAMSFFKEHFNHECGVGIENRRRISDETEEIEFYSLEDPAMDDTFFCQVKQ